MMTKLGTQRLQVHPPTQTPCCVIRPEPMQLDAFLRNSRPIGYALRRPQHMPIYAVAERAEDQLAVVGPQPIPEHGSKFGVNADAANLVPLRNEIVLGSCHHIQVGARSIKVAVLPS